MTIITRIYLLLSLLLAFLGDVTLVFLIGFRPVGFVSFARLFESFCHQPVRPAWMCTRSIGRFAVTSVRHFPALLLLGFRPIGLHLDTLVVI